MPIMPKTALVLSGGGAKGAFQVGAERYAREVCDYDWDVIAGVSVGALNASMLALRRYDRLLEIWRTITNDQVYTGSLNLWSALGMILGKRRSVYSNAPIRHLIESELGDAEFPADIALRVGAVSLMSGAYQVFTPADPHFVRAVIASTAMPVIWEPLDVGPEWPEMVDGGLRNISPLGDVLDFDPREIVIINCNPREPQTLQEAPRNVIGIAKRALLDIALNEIFTTDLREFLRLNGLVQQAATQGVTLRKPDGSALREYGCHIIEPQYSLGDTLDFTRGTLTQSMDAGWERAREVLGAGVSPI